MFAGLRLIETTYLYDDPEHPDRITGSLQSPPYTPEDHALLLGLDLYERSLCRCGHPREIAWHSDMDGWWEGQDAQVVCYACSAAHGKEIAYTLSATNTRPADRPLPPFQLGVTTAAPAPDSSHD